MTDILENLDIGAPSKFTHDEFNARLEIFRKTGKFPKRAK